MKAWRIDSAEGRDAIQRALGRMERWAHADLMELNKAKCKVLQLGGGIPSTDGGWAENGLRAALRRRIWGCRWMEDST